MVLLVAVIACWSSADVAPSPGTTPLIEWRVTQIEANVARLITLYDTMLYLLIGALATGLTTLAGQIVTARRMKRDLYI